MSVERHVSHTVILRIFLTVLMMAQSIFVTRLLGPEARGLFAKLQAAQSFFILFLGLGVTSAITYYISNRKLEHGKVLGFAFCCWLVGAGFLGLFQWLTLRVPSIDLIFPAGFSSHFYEIYFFTSFLFNSLQLVFNSALSGRQRFDMCNAMELVVAAMRVVIFCGYFAGKFVGFYPSVHSIFLADLSLTMIRAVLFFICYRKEFGFQFLFSLKGTLRPMLGFSILIYVSYLINFLYLRADYWIIERQLGLKELGVYSVAAGLAQFLTFIPMTLNMVMLPHLSATKETEALERLGMFSRLNASALMLLTSILVFFASPVVLVCYGRAFEAAILPLRIVSISFFMLSLKHLFAYYNLSQGRARHNIFAELLGLSIGLSGDFLLIPRYGIVGASYAAVAANLVSLLYVFVGIVQGGNVRYFDLFVVDVKDLRNLVSSVLRSPAEETL